MHHGILTWHEPRGHEQSCNMYFHVLLGKVFATSGMLVVAARGTGHIQYVQRPAYTPYCTL